jgi:5-formyltetrahydrofolate cyclo-ligase
LFVPYNSNTSLQINKFGIYEPLHDLQTYNQQLTPTLIFMPLIAFDEQKYRVGFGQGYYDRTLQQPKLSTVITIGLAYDFQRVEKRSLKRVWENPLSKIVTPSNIW